MPDLLFLCRRVPYPPNRGDRIRTWHMLRHLARRHRVFLGCMVETPGERRWAGELTQLCAGTHLAEPPRHLGPWIAETVAAHRPSHAVAVSTEMAALVPAEAAPLRRRVVDMVQVESARRREDAARRRWPFSLAHRRAAHRLLDIERRTAQRFDASLFASAREAALFRALAPECAGRVAHVEHGVDTEYFSPARDYPNPFPNDRKAIVLAGVEDGAGLDGAEWFVREVLPVLRARRLAADLWIVGTDQPALRRLVDPPGVTLAAAHVDDLRPYLAHAAVVVAPLRRPAVGACMALEAMAMARPVVATPLALEGLTIAAGREVAEARDAGGFALALAAALSGRGAEAMGVRARERVVAEHGWRAGLARLDAALEG